MNDDVRAVVGGEEAYVVGGAVRDELLGRPIVDVDVACRDPRGAAQRYAARVGGAVFPLSERHGAWRVALRDGRTVDLTPLRGEIEDDLRTRDFTINAIARPVAGGADIDPLAGRDDLRARLVRAVSERIFDDDPARLLRAVRFEDELSFRLTPETEELVARRAHLVTLPAGERILDELERLSADGFRRGLAGTDVLIEGNRRRVVGAVSMDSFAVELGDEAEGARVTLLGEGLLAEDHARVAGTINYEVTCAIRSSPERASRRAVDE